MYEVLRAFTDLQDDGYVYNVGDTFPHIGKKVTESRIQELSTNNNKIGVPLIKEVVVKKEEAIPDSESNMPKFEEKRGHRKNARTSAEGTEELLHN